LALTLSRRRRQRRDLPQHAGKQPPRQMPFGQQQPVVARMLDETSAGRIRRAQSGADFGDDAEAQVEVCENLVGEAAVSGILCQREAELARCGGVESPFYSKQRSNFAFAKLPVSVRD